MTFSLVGRCARTGMLGAVVTTSSISVGSRCSHARAGIGAALTQHRTDPRLGPLALDLLAHGFSAPEAMQAVVAATPHRHWRQLALIDAAGRTAVYSGANVRGRARRGAGQGLRFHRQHRAVATAAAGHGRALSRPRPTSHWRAACSMRLRPAKRRVASTSR